MAYKPKVLVVAEGGTGVATLGDAGVLIGNGTGNVQVTGAGTSGQVLTSNGPGVDPTFQTGASGTVTTLTGNTGGALSPTAGNFNTVGTGSITIAGSGSTLTTQLTGLTNHNVLIGAGTATITNVAPSATSGIPLVSNGASADPSFTTAVVAGGGTGNTTFTAYSVIAAGTTATGAFQNVSGVGTSGQILTSNGASALPTWQTAPTGVFAPNSTVILWDDFISSDGEANGIIGNMGWKSSNTTDWVPTAGIATTSNAHPGIIKNTAQVATNAAAISLGSGGATTGPANTIILGGGAITLNWVVKINTLSIASPRYILRFGLISNSNVSTVDIVDGVYFEYSDNINSGNWVGSTASASSRTPANSAVAADTNYHNFMITINAAATSCGFFIDGVQIANSPIAATIPTVALKPKYGFVATVGTTAANSLEVDLFYMTQILTSAR